MLPSFEHKRSTIWRAEFNEHLDLFYGFRITLTLGDIEPYHLPVAARDRFKRDGFKVELTSRNHGKDPSRSAYSHYSKQIAHLKSPEGRRAFLIRNGIVSPRFPEDVPAALHQHRLNMARALWGDVTRDNGVNDRLMQTFLSLPDEPRFTLQAFKRALPGISFEAPCLEGLVLLLRYLQQSPDDDFVSRMNRLQELLGQPQIPAYWLCIAGAGAGLIHHRSKLHARLAPVAGVLESKSVEGFLATYRHLLQRPEDLGPTRAVDLILRHLGPHLPSAAPGEALFRMLGEEGVAFAPDDFAALSEGAARNTALLHCHDLNLQNHTEYNSALKHETHKLTEKFARYLDQYRCGRLARQIPDEPTLPAPDYTATL